MSFTPFRPYRSHYKPQFSTSYKSHQSQSGDSSLQVPTPKFSQYGGEPSRIPRDKAFDDAVRTIVAYEEKVSRLHQYLQTTQQLDKQAIHRIFWQGQGRSSDSEQKQVLRELSRKVQALIKENNSLRSRSGGRSENEELFDMMKENDKLKALLQDLQKGEAHRETALLQQNRYLRDFVSNYRSSSPKRTTQPVKPVQLLSYNTELNALESHFKKIIEQITVTHSDKIEKQARLLDVMEKRLIYVEQKESKRLEHMQFERSVNTQKSPRKNRIFLSNSPPIKGDQYSSNIDEDATPAPSTRRKLFTDTQLSVIPTGNPQEQEDSGKVKPERNRENEQIVLELQREVDSLNRQVRKLTDEQQKLLSDKKELQKLVDLNDFRSSAHKEVIQQLENQIALLQADQLKKGAEDHFIEEVRSIKESIQSCELSKANTYQNQIETIIEQRNGLAVKVKECVGSVDRSKVAKLERQLRLMNEKNIALQQSIDTYERKLTRLQDRINDLQVDSDTKQSRQISNEIELMNTTPDGYSVLKWQKQAWSSVETSVVRLQKLEDSLKRKQK